MEGGPAALTTEPARTRVCVLEADEAALHIAAAHVPQHPEQLQQHERGQHAQEVALAHTSRVHRPGQQEQQPCHEHIQPVLAAQSLRQLLWDAGAAPGTRDPWRPLGQGLRGRWACRDPRRRCREGTCGCCGRGGRARAPRHLPIWSPGGCSSPARCSWLLSFPHALWALAELARALRSCPPPVFSALGQPPSPSS